MNATLLDRDVMQVCLNGHVITDRLATSPEEGRPHCDRCGAATLCRCPTCGSELPGAVLAPGLLTIGGRRAPKHCPGCGAPLPWSRPAAPAPALLDTLEPLLRRLPFAARQLRDRHGNRPALRIEDEHDLEDVLRVVLHLHFDDVRREGRTPGYALDTRTDFVIGPDRVAVTAKLLRTAVREAEVDEQLREDVGYYQRQHGCSGLLALVYDPEQMLAASWRFEAPATELEIRCVLAQ